MNQTEWPAAEVTLRQISELTPYKRNARTHSKAQIEELCESIKLWGWTNPVLIDEEGTILAGHGRVMAAERLELAQVPCIVAEGWSDEQKAAYVIADNKLALNAGWDLDILATEFADLKAVDFDLTLTGFSAKELGKILEIPSEEHEGADDFQAVKDAVTTEPGDVWLLGPHRIVCGDSTDMLDVMTLIGDEAVDVIHADPPYGMGKQSEGVENDNLYRDKLDAFQMEWLKLFKAQLRENGSLYIWGNAPDLWRLWYRGGLESEEWSVRNEIVWDKGSAIGMASSGERNYPVGTERCLLLLRGKQSRGNLNKDEYWEGFEPLRLWLCEQRKHAGFSVKDINRITGTKMAGHWFGRSQFAVIGRKHYNALRQEAGGSAFGASYDEVVGELFPGIIEQGEEYRRSVSEAVFADRTYFDNSHDIMTDVWRFDRVRGAERFGHATPKPVAMLGRAVKTSCPEGGVVVEPFLGTGSTLIACEDTGRRCLGMELKPVYVDVAVRRWQDRTGEQAVLRTPGRPTFDEVCESRKA